MRSMTIRWLLLVFALGFVGAAVAQQRPKAKDIPPPPPPAETAAPAPSVPGPTVDELEPEVTITTKGTEIHEEHRYNGQLYMVKVTPKNGPPYYLIYDERGTLRRSDLQPDTIVPTWVIKRF